MMAKTHRSHFDVVAALAFVVKAIDPCNRRTLVIPAEQEEILWVFGFVAEHQCDRF